MPNAIERIMRFKANSILQRAAQDSQDATDKYFKGEAEEANEIFTNFNGVVDSVERTNIILNHTTKFINDLQDHDIAPPSVEEGLEALGGELHPGVEVKLPTKVQNYWEKEKYKREVQAKIRPQISVNRRVFPNRIRENNRNLPSDNQIEIPRLDMVEKPQDIKKRMGRGLSENQMKIAEALVAVNEDQSYLYKKRDDLMSHVYGDITYDELKKELPIFKSSFNRLLERISLIKDLPLESLKPSENEVLEMLLTSEVGQEKSIDEIIDEIKNRFPDLAVKKRK